MIPHEKALEALRKYIYSPKDTLLFDYVRQQQKKDELIKLYKRLSYYAKYDGDDVETKERVLELKEEITKIEEELR